MINFFILRKTQLNIQGLTVDILTSLVPKFVFTCNHSGFSFTSILTILLKWGRTLLRPCRPLSLGLPWWLRGQKNPPATQETWVRSLGWEDPLEEEMATHSSILAWEIPWTEEPGWLQSMGSQKSLSN